MIAPRAGAQTSGATGVQLPLALDFASLFKAALGRKGPFLIEAAI